MFAFLRFVTLERRFGRASKLHASGNLERALALYSDNRVALAAAASLDAAELSLRVLNLINVARVALEIGRSDLAKSALEEWLQVRGEACRAFPDYARAVMFTKWEQWVLHTLSTCR